MAGLSECKQIIWTRYDRDNPPQNSDLESQSASKFRMASLVPDPEVVARVKLKWSDWVRVEMLSARWVDTSTGHVKRQKPRKAIDRTPPDPANAGRYILADPHRGDVRIITIGHMVDEVLGEWVNRNLTITGTVDAFYRQFFSSRAGPRDEDVRKIIAWYKEIVEEVAKERKEAAWKIDRRAARKPVEVAAMATFAKKSKLVQHDGVPGVKKEDKTFRGMRKEGPTQPQCIRQGTSSTPAPRSINFNSRGEENATTKLTGHRRHLQQDQMEPDSPIKSARSTLTAPLEKQKKASVIPRMKNNDTSESLTSLNKRLRQENSVSPIGLLNKKAIDQDFSVKPVSRNVRSEEKETENLIAKLSVHLHRQNASPETANSPASVSKKDLDPQKPLILKPDEDSLSTALAIRAHPRVKRFEARPNIGREPTTSQHSQTKHRVLVNDDSATIQQTFSRVQNEFPANFTPPSGPRSTRAQRSDSILPDYKRRTQSPIKERFDVVGRFQRDGHPPVENQNATRTEARPLCPPAERRDRQVHLSSDSYRPYYGPDLNTQHVGELSRGRFERGRERGWSLSGGERHLSRHAGHNSRDYDGGYRMGGSHDEHRS